MDYIWMLALVITHMVAYYMGRNDGAALIPDEDDWVAVKKYEIDKRFEHLRWIAERNERHGS